MLLYLVGSKGQQLYQTIKPSMETLENVLKTFDTHCNPPKNETVDHYRFFIRNREEGESFEAYPTELKLLAIYCNFGYLQDSLIRDRVICRIRESALRERDSSEKLTSQWRSACRFVAHQSCQRNGLGSLMDRW